MVWSGTTSQIANTGPFILCGLLAIPTLGLSLFYALWKYLVISNQTFELTTQRLTCQTGIFNKSVDQLELYRVRDTRLDQPFFLRLFGFGNLTLVTTDATSPIVLIAGVAGPAQLREKIRNLVEERRSQKQVRMIDAE